MRVTLIALFVFVLIGALAAFTGAAALRPENVQPDGSRRTLASTSDQSTTPTPTPTPLPIIAEPTLTPATPTPTVAPPTPTPAPTRTAATPTAVATPVASPTIPTTGPHLDPGWQQAIKTEDGGTLGRVTADMLNVRSAPKLDAPSVGATYKMHPVTIYEAVVGDAVEGLPVWYRIGEGQYIAATYAEPFIATAPKSSYEGHWVDINLSTFYATAYDGDTPVYAAIIIAGQEREGTRTPVGEFTIFRRVESEIMDAATLGIKKTDPDYYYLPNVKWTQYFAADGVALHTNYWSHPSLFGARGSHGCVNLLEKDAAFFWSFVGNGSAVSVHM